MQGGGYTGSPNPSSVARRASGCLVGWGDPTTPLDPREMCSEGGGSGCLGVDPTSPLCPAGSPPSLPPDPPATPDRTRIFPVRRRLPLPFPSLADRPKPVRWAPESSQALVCVSGGRLSFEMQHLGLLLPASCLPSGGAEGGEGPSQPQPPA